MIDAAIVGLGRWGKTLVEAVQGKSERLRFTHAVSRDPAKLRGYAAQHRLELASTVDPVLANPDIDAIVLATPHSLHCEQIIAVAAAGKAVFCEKPLTLTRAEAALAIEACHRAGVVLGVGTDKRFFPSFSELRRQVKSGELGDILHIEAHFSNEVAGAFTEWRFSPEELPAGGMTGTGIHVLDAMISMAGPVRRVLAQLLARKPPPDPLDSLAVLLEFSSGISGTLAAVRSTPTYCGCTPLGGMPRPRRWAPPSSCCGAAAASRSTSEVPPVNTVKANLEAFADAVAGHSSYPVPTGEMLATVAAFEAIVDAITPRRIG